MVAEGVKRKLTAIFSADVKGYSRLMGENEEATIRTLRAYREVMSGLIEKHRGRIVDSPGDNVLAEFASVVEGVRCAVEIQEELKARNADLPEDRKMEFRIGVNLGDVVEEGEQIYGDGVNIASRVEGLAEGGGICVSGSAYEQIKNKLDLGFEYLGERTVKNIAEPLKVYSVLMEPEAAGKVIGEKKVGLKGRQWVAGAIVALIAVAVGAIIWNFIFRSTSSPKKAAILATTAIPLTGRASIAVLPFKNLSGNQEQEYFSDGITNDIITDLSKFREMFVIASNTVFTYKGKPVNVKEVSRELGVRYVLEGSVQKAGDDVRINAQLIDATTGLHLWAERYERGIKDLFSVQDEIVQMIVATLAIKIDAAERARVMRKDSNNLEAYDYVLRGEELISRRTRSANVEAKKMFKKAIELDSRYEAAYVGLGWSYYFQAVAGWTEFPEHAMEKALAYGQKALSLGEPDALTHALLGSVYLRLEKYDLAITELQQAVKLNPNHARSHLQLGTIMLYTGRTDEAIQLLQTGLRYHPYADSEDYWRLALAYYLKGEYDEAIRTWERSLGRNPNNVWIHMGLAAAYAQAGRSEDAKRSADMIRRLHPFFEVESSFTLFQNPADRDKILDGLRKAGLE
jgi:adenylate cyclase